MKKEYGIMLLGSMLLAACLFSGCGKEEAWLSELKQEEEISAEMEQQEEEISVETEKREEEPPEDAEAVSVPVPEKIYVHVCGEVVKPGVYELPAGSRFFEAVEAAGGFTEQAGRDYLNMAGILEDGSRLEIPSLEEEKAVEEAPCGNEGQAVGTYYTVDGAQETEELVNINTADKEKLCSLSGIGESRAEAIIEYRETQGPFQKKEDIMHVSGIGRKMYEKIEDYLTVS